MMYINGDKVEIMNKNDIRKITAAVFDFDGTISTLRCGWEAVMREYMLEILGSEAAAMIDAYIDESAGIQTIFQMKWLAEKASEPLDPWDYKAEYNRRLMLAVEKKKAALAAGEISPDEYLMAGAADFLRLLRDHAVALYAASGTDHPDVVTEAKALGVYGYFDEIAGAPLGEEACSKEAVLRRLMEDSGIPAQEMLVVGDGRVEIALGKAAGAHTIGLESDEVRRQGVNPVKRERLLRAGADIIMGDFLELDALRAYLRLE